MKFLKPFFVFLIINFGALGIGMVLMGDGATSDWYTSMNQAPWTPPGWVFGASWTLIMICFSVYMTFLYLKLPIKTVFTLFTIQFVLNVAWNFAFFNQHLVFIGLIIILGLTIVVATILITFWKLMKIKNVLIAPYAIWLCIASSLNLYILVNN